jgi:hypothetical protein
VCLCETCPKCGRIFARQNQSHYCGGAPADIDAYLDRQSPQAQPHLRQIAVAIRAQIPGARGADKMEYAGIFGWKPFAFLCRV